MTERPRLAVVGAGPAGLAAALAAAARGVQVTLVDAADQAGGQFYRQPAAALGARLPSSSAESRTSASGRSNSGSSRSRTSSKAAAKA
ncbi:FAD-dependent oxidoreductase, partial [Streptomyces olivaceoviridis]